MNNSDFRFKCLRNFVNGNFTSCVINITFPDTDKGVGVVTQENIILCNGELIKDILAEEYILFSRKDLDILTALGNLKNLKK